MCLTSEMNGIHSRFTDNSHLSIFQIFYQNIIVNKLHKLQEFWRFSDMTCSAYPLTALDTIRPDGSTSQSLQSLSATFRALWKLAFAKRIMMVFFMCACLSVCMSGSSNPRTSHAKAAKFVPIMDILSTSLIIKFQMRHCTYLIVC